MRFIISIINFVRTLQDRLAIGSQIQISNEIALRKLRAEQLKRYSDFLNDKKAHLEPLMDEVAEQARTTLEEIRYCIDEFSELNNYNTQKMRYRFNTIIGHFFNAYSYEINWQTTENIYFMRFPGIRDLQLDYEYLKPGRRKINREALSWKKFHLDGELIHTQEFLQLLNTFFNQISLPSQLYQKVVVTSKPVFTLLQQYRSDFQVAINDLERFKAINKLEEVKIEESFELDSEYCSFLNKLKFCEHFYLIESWSNPKMKDCYLSRILVIGLFLILLERYKLWGHYVSAF